MTERNSGRACDSDAAVRLAVTLAIGCSLALASCAGGASHPRTKPPPYQNPVGGTIRLGDPFVLRHEGRYYLYGTAYRDGFPAFSSSDLVNWQEAGTIWRDDSGICLDSHWAPEVHAYRERFYLIFSCQVAAPPGPPAYRLGLAVAARPTGPFETLKLPWLEGERANIDPHLFFDAGKPYLFFNEVGADDGIIWGEIHAVALAPSLLQMASAPVLIIKASQPWENPHGGNRTNEGAFVFEREGRYYLTYSANHYADPNYGIGYATAAAPLGPWTKSPRNPILARNPARAVSGPGHSSIVPSPDGSELFIVYHAHATPEAPSGSRTVNIDRLRFDPAGALQVLGPTRTPQPGPR